MNTWLNNYVETNSGKDQADTIQKFGSQKCDIARGHHASDEKRRTGQVSSGHIQPPLGLATRADRRRLLAMVQTLLAKINHMCGFPWSHTYNGTSTHQCG